MSERLQKWFSLAGICSRRQAEAWIAEGRVTVNGAPAVLGQRVDPERDTICVDGKAITPANEELVYIMLNKPRGYVCSVKDEQGRKTVMDLVQGEGHRLDRVGRLDMFSQGLLLMTNDGALTKALTHPSHDVKKEYQVRVIGDLDSALSVLRGPMVLDGKLLKPCKVRVLRNAAESALLLFELTEGKNRQIRRMCETAGLRVVRLRRISEAGIRLGSLREGEWRYLTDHEVKTLLTCVNPLK